MKLARLAENDSRSRQRDAGFSLPEILVVVMIILCITAVALPNTMHMVANYRARGTMGGMSGTIQECRSLAISKNQRIAMHFGLTGGETVAYLQYATEAPDYSKALKQMAAGGGVVMYRTLPGGAGAPSDLTASPLWTTTAVSKSSDISFNSRGLPCWDDSGVCSTGYGFLYYFTYQPPFGSNGWTAISVSPAGRIKTWLWDGSKWIN
jgi:prepilin-type N-terminal cleavage/methylation domain-containing protein